MLRALRNMGMVSLMVVMIFTSAFSTVLAQAISDVAEAETSDAGQTATADVIMTPAPESTVPPIVEPVTQETVVPTSTTSADVTAEATDATIPKDSIGDSEPTAEAPASTSDAEVTQGQQPAGEQVLASAAVVQIVSEGDGTLHAWAPVNIYAEGATEPAFGGLLNATGTLTLNNIPFGIYTVVVEAHGPFQPTTLEVHVFDETSPVVVHVPYITYQLATVEILGGVNDQDHAGQYAYLFPVGPGESIYGLLDDTGSVDIPNVPVGEYTLMIAAHGKYADVSQMLTVLDPTTSAVPAYSLLATGSLAIDGGNSGSSHAGAKVTIRPRSVGVQNEGVLDQTGSFTFSDVPFGVYDLTIAAHTGYLEFTEIIWIPDTGTLTPVYEEDPNVVIQTTLAVAPGAVRAGDTVTITGSGFQPYENVTIRLAGPNGTVIGETVAFADGRISTTIQIPTWATVRNYWVSVIGISGQQGLFLLNVTGLAIPKISVNPDSARVGDLIEITGTGYKPNETVTIRLGGPNGTLIETVNADSAGQFWSLVEVPAWATVRAYWISAMGAGGQQGLFLLQVTQLAKVNLEVSPSQVAAGSYMSVWGSGYRPNERVTIRISGPNGPIIGSAVASSQGTISTSVQVPLTAAARNHWISAIGTSGQSGLVLINVTRPEPATLSASPDQVARGESIFYSGFGFLPNETVTIRLSGPNGVVLGTTRADGDGWISGSVTIPANAPLRSHWLSAMGSSRQHGLYLITVVQLDKSISVYPDSVRAGDTITVTGFGFAAYDSVTIRLGGPNGKFIGSASTNASGEFLQEILIPASTAARSYWISAMGSGGSNAIYLISVTSSTPPNPPVWWLPPPAKYTCSSFSTQAEAQRYFNMYPVHASGLDRDKDGIACETLPR